MDGEMRTSMSTGCRDQLPLALRSLDHYTLIVADARQACDFHVSALGFTLLRVQDVGVDSDADGSSYAMRNYILTIPGEPGKTCVITEGLSDESIFTKYLRIYGPGIHHIAYCVEDLDAVVASLRSVGTGFTSNDVVRDPTTGLRQIFIDRAHAGYFVELIERSTKAAEGIFTNTNMSRLVRTMSSYLPAASSGCTPTNEPKCGCDGTEV